jgi:hypothetical protein
MPDLRDPDTPTLVDGPCGGRKTTRKRGAHGRGLEAASVGSQPVVSFRVEVRGGRYRHEADVRAVDWQARSYVEGSHPFWSEHPLVAGEGVHVGAGGRHVYLDVPDRLGPVHQGQDSPVAGEGTDLLQRQHLAVRPVDVGEGDEARLRRQRGFDLLRRYWRRHQVDLHPEAPSEIVERREAAGVFGGDRECFVALSPVDRGDAEVHAVGCVLGEGHVVGASTDEPPCGLAGPRGVLRLSVEEANALQVGGS